MEDLVASILLTGILWVLLALVAGTYVYMSLAFMAIAKKAKLKTPGLAWIPGIGPEIIAYQTSKMHWWPWLLLIGYLIPFVSGLFGIVFAVFGVIWQWKMFEAVKKPGWWALLSIIPIVGLVMVGVAAWSKD